MRKTILLIGAAILLAANGVAKEIVSKERQQQTSEKAEQDEKGGLIISGYGQIDYNQVLDSDTRNNGKLDIHRMVMLFGYRFNPKTLFVTEIEYEHVKEVYVEQAYLQYKINSWLNLKGGLLLIPMGIINEYHEPPTFFGVERPLIDKYIAPTTWREIGIGFSGHLTNAAVKYQLYLVNGFNGYDGAGKLNGKNGLRKGRQKGAESYISSPNLTGKLEYYGMRKLKLGLSVYHGNSQSTLYNGIDKNDDLSKETADSSIVGISMIGADATYNSGALTVKGQFYYTSLRNTDKYNQFTSGDLGSAMMGYYVEAGYNVSKHFASAKTDLIPFVRFEKYNTHASTDGFNANEAYENQSFSAGLNWRVAQGAVFKTEMQFLKSKDMDENTKILNTGIAIMF